MGGASTGITSLGSILNGFGTNLVAGGNPIKGALINASLLAGSGDGGAGNILNTSSGGGFSAINGGNYGSIGTAGQAASSGGSYIGGGFEPSISGFGQGAMESLGSVNRFINANPVTSQIGFSLAKDALTPEQLQYAPAGQIQRGQFNPVDYMSLLNPQGRANQQNQYAQQPISLL